MTSDGPFCAPSAARAAPDAMTDAAPAQAAARSPGIAVAGTEERAMGWIRPSNMRRLPIGPVPAKPFRGRAFRRACAAAAEARLQCNCKLFATRLWKPSEGIVWMAVSSLPEAQSAPTGYSKTGWRRGRGAPSLSEVFGSIATRPQGPLWRRLIAFLGPGYLVAVGYMDPGNWATSLAGGSKFGYALLTIALLSNLIAILLQALCARLGIGAGRDLA